MIGLAYLGLTESGAFRYLCKQGPRSRFVNVSDTHLMTGDSRVYACQDMSLSGRVAFLQVDRDSSASEDRAWALLAATSACRLFDEQDEDSQRPVSEFAEDLAYHISACLTRRGYDQKQL